MALLESSAEEGARLLALGLLDQAHAAADRVGHAQDAEALHDLRVALRRLRSCLRAYDAILGPAIPKRLQRRMRKLAKRTGPGRDAEVRLKWLREEGSALDDREQYGVRWLEARLSASVEGEYDRLRRTMPAKFVKLAQAPLELHELRD